MPSYKLDDRGGCYLVIYTNTSPMRLGACLELLLLGLVVKDFSSSSEVLPQPDIGL